MTPQPSTARAAGPAAIRLRAGMALAALLHVPAVHAVKLSDPASDVQVQWDNTFKYNAAFRVKQRSDALVADLNQDDGDRNFSRGLISNRIDLLSEFDLRYKRSAGLRVSAAAWYDSVYHGRNDNDSPTTNNNVSVPADHFSEATRGWHGSRAEILDAFAFTNGEVGGLPYTLRLGRHTLLYGESLFFGANGIAGAQAPIDLIKLLSVPNTQFKELARPVAQVSGQLQLPANVTLGAYYQFEWRRTILPSVGSYFSGADVFDNGERFLFGPVDPVTRLGPALANDNAWKPRNSGQGGVQLRWRPEAVDVELGFYAVRYHDKTPQLALFPAQGRYQLAYPEGITAYGASFSTQVGSANVAGEVSMRRHTPLVSDPAVVGVTVPATALSDNDANPLYAVGKSAHAQLSAIYLGSPTPLWASSTFLGEIAWNRRLSVEKNPNAVAANSSRDAWALRFVFEPAWFQVANGLDLSAPVGLGWSAKGNSSVVTGFNPAGRRGGGLSLGVKGVYEQVWRLALNFTHYFGPEGTALNPLGQLTFKQNFADRDFIALSLQRAF